jgi:hypothetical protein
VGTERAAAEPRGWGGECVGWDVLRPGLGGAAGHDYGEIPVRFYTLKFSLHCELWLIGHWAKCQSDKRHGSKCK